MNAIRRQPRVDLAATLAELGISADYGADSHLPCYEEARDLVEVEANFTGKVQQLERDTAKLWHGMKLAALADGIELQLVSGFRSIARQKELIAEKLAAGKALGEILKVVAAPGFSQHHTGMALDLTTGDVDPLSEDFETTPAFRWLNKHTREHGFYLPYPRDNPSGFIYEPWHWASVQLKHPRRG
jgi:D-alanyl-D-alanine carboxypeptidase